jgi:hypothetical protein
MRIYLEPPQLCVITWSHHSYASLFGINTTTHHYLEPPQLCVITWSHHSYASLLGATTAMRHCLKSPPLRVIILSHHNYTALLGVPTSMVITWSHQNYSMRHNLGGTATMRPYLGPRCSSTLGYNPPFWPTPLGHIPEYGFPQPRTPHHTPLPPIYTLQTYTTHTDTVP